MRIFTCKGNDLFQTKFRVSQMPFLSSESRNIKTCDDRHCHFPLQSESTFCRYAIETLPAQLKTLTIISLDILNETYTC